MTTEYGVFIGGKWEAAKQMDDICDKYDGTVVGAVGVPSADQVSRAVESAHDAVWSGDFPPEKRVEVLRDVAALVEARTSELTELHTAETGFTLTESRLEIGRTVRTLQLCAEEVKRLCGELVPISWYPGGDGKTAYTDHRPIGPVCAITPFNSPLNTVAHKLGPALGAGNSVVLKPSVQAPLSAARFIDLLVEAGLPEGYVSLVFGGAQVGEQLLQDQRFGFYAFTGSSGVGRHIAATIGIRRSQLELGSIASTIVCADADPDDVARQVSVAGFRKAGQVCTSVQRLLVHQDVVDEVTERLVMRVEAIRVGDPRDPTSTIGPMIAGGAAARASGWVAEARDAGATVLTGGDASGSLMQPTVVTGASDDMRVVNQEIFAPVVVVEPYQDLRQAVAAVNASPYGLAAGVFTNDYRLARTVARSVRVGTLQINATSSNRFDSMPFGGVKDSGFGKEGPRYAMRSMTDEVLVIWN